MLKKVTILITTTLLLLYACGTPKNVISTESQLNTAFQNQDYNLVLQLFDKIEHDKKNNNIDPSVIEMAGIAAFKTGKWDKAHIYLTRIVDANSGPDIIGMLGTNYTSWGEKTLEYQHWNKYLDKLKGTSHYNQATTRLFLLNIENNNTEKALEVWPIIEDKSNADLQFEYLKLLEQTEKTTQALSFSEEILKNSPQHEPTLFWRARYYYDKAEKLYDLEMAKYNRSPDYTAYAYLRRELKKISADYRTARDLFIQLHAINPDHSNYIRYLKNCYLRLEMKKEAEQMDQKLNALLKQ